MNEFEWLACADPSTMLAFLRGTASARKLRLFACACCRRVWPLLTDDQSRQAVVVAEDYADGRAAVAFLREAREAAARAAEVLRERDRDIPPCLHMSRRAFAADAAAYTALGPDEGRGTIGPEEPAETAAANAVCYAAIAEDAGTVPGAGANQEQAVLFRDIFGPLPFRPVAIDSAWLRWNQGTVPAIARRIYEERAFPDLPILADALEDAGCTDANILEHCRRPGEHVRGCWVVDLILGQS